MTASLQRCGFYPAGGGRIAFEIAPCSALRTLTLFDRGATQVRARSLVASLPEGIVKRELSIVRERLALERHLCRVESIEECVGPGNVLLIVIEGESITEIVTGFGIKGVSAEKVASEACDVAERYLKADVPVGSHLADQLLIPMALAGSGSFRTLSPSGHTQTNAGVVRRFLDVPIAIEEEAEETFRITIGPRQEEGPMNTRELIAIGFPAGACARHAKQVLQQAHAAKLDMAIVREDLKRLALSPSSFVDHEAYGELARKVQDIAATGRFQPRKNDAPYRIWGEDLESEALTQMRNACKLPVAVSGALMPDAHVGYGLPIGGVLATKHAVIPYAVGVDIACRMKMSVLDLPLATLSDDQDRLARVLQRETQFGVGANFRSPRQHDVMDEDWTVTAVTAKMKDRACRSWERAEVAITSSSSES